MPVIAISASLASVWLTGLIRNTLSAPSNARRAVAGAVAQISLQLHALVSRRASGAAGALQILAELLEERGVVRQPEHDRDGLPAAPRLLHAQLRDRPLRNLLARRLPALAPALGLP